MGGSKDFKNKPQGRREIEGPRLMQVEDVENDL
jgi:hypothetical protein